MANPPNPSETPDDQRRDGTKVDSAQVQESAQQPRPVGHVGGHTVQDWEQPAPGPTLPRPEPAADPESKTEEGLIVDPSPPTTPLYLRPVAAPTPEAVPFDAKEQTLTAQSAALVDALARGMAESLVHQLRPVVAATIAQLLPMLLSLGNTPDAEGSGRQAGAAVAPAAAAGAVNRDDVGEAGTAA